MGYDMRDKLQDCWSRIEQFYTLLYGNSTKQNRLLHMLQPLHFAEKSKRPDQDTEYERLWKIRIMPDTLHQAYDKSNNLSKPLVVYTTNVKLKGRVILRLKWKCCGIKIYKLCDISGYTNDQGKKILYSHLYQLY